MQSREKVAKELFLPLSALIKAKRALDHDGGKQQNEPKSTKRM